MTASGDDAGVGTVLLGSATLRHVGALDRIRLTAAAGMKAIGIDRRQIRADGVDGARVAEEAKAAGIPIVELELLGDALEPDSESAPTFVPRLCALANELGAGRIVCVTWRAGPPAQAAVRFARLCDIAADYGVKLAIEFAPWTEVPDLRTAAEIAERAGKDNGGIVFDTWHFSRGVNALADIDAVPADRVFCVQVSDGPPPVPDLEPHEETRRRRMVPGTGTFSLVEILGALWRHGARPDWSIEVLSDDLNAMDPFDAISLLARSTNEVLRAACR